MQQCDRNTMEHFGVISPVLMERAALKVFEKILELTGDKDTGILILCGTGNNGGDGLALARLLFLAGYRTVCVYPGKREKASPEGARQLQIAENYKIPIYADLPDGQYGIVVDALFGIGLSRPVEGIYRQLIEACNEQKAIRVAVDIPSGIDTDTGQVLGTAFRADHTVTFGFAKVGQMLYPGAEYCGALTVADIGIDEYSLLDIPAGIRLVTKEDLQILPKRRPDGNKGTCGKIAIFAGSRNMAGAAILAARAAYASGAGLVMVVTPEENRIILQTSVPEAILTTFCTGEEQTEAAERMLAWADAIVAGPGIGKGEAARAMLGRILDGHAKHPGVPLVLDADALNLMAAEPSLFDHLIGCCVLTPHPGEMSRISGLSIADIQKNPVSVAKRFANRYNSIVIQKDARTVTALPDGSVFINSSGNDGMATGGSGDVLSGILGCLLASASKAAGRPSGMSEIPAEGLTAALAVCLHGAAGDLAARKKGRHGMTAADLIPALAECLRLVETADDRSETADMRRQMRGHAKRRIIE